MSGEVDEGHLLDADQLEELRLLTNADMAAAHPCLPPRRPTHPAQAHQLGAFAAVDQRIALRCTLPGMDLEATTGYVRHHLLTSPDAPTCCSPIRSDHVLALIHQTSRGLPRAVNNLAVQSLVAAYTDNKGIVDDSSTRPAITEVTSV